MNIMQGQFYSVYRDYVFTYNGSLKLPPFQGARPDHVRIESSSCCFSKELVSFVRPGEFKTADLHTIL